MQSNSNVNTREQVVLYFIRWFIHHNSTLMELHRYKNISNMKPIFKARMEEILYNKTKWDVIERSRCSAKRGVRMYAVSFWSMILTAVRLLLIRRNTCLVFILVPGTDILNPWNTLCSVIKVSFVVLMRDFGKHLSMGAGCQWSQPCG